MILPVIMAGGTGSRLWPMSRELYPKQFLRLGSEFSMLQETIFRLDGLDVSDP
ncbi:TPA: mannose-1-phosphate guanylyltransferase/mannose-6-phosphate isomerase, partial [Klebsiella pneumoniae]|nr:mannose-1-phosphate guanylyltransferase/mannose-6-phosphate isomerase [Klebsiella pneumoniae]